jgi:malate dehydrogenase (oxaloacetate-decarboxylating)(NADP+)
LVAASNFGSRDIPSAERMRRALALINKAAPDLAIDGEMHADSALSPVIRERILPESKLIGPANLLIMPSLDAANIGYNLVKTLTGCVSVGPILIGPRLPAHIVTASITTRGIVNLSALAGVQAMGKAA